MKKIASLMLALLPLMVFAIPEIGGRTETLAVGQAAPEIKTSRWIKGDEVAGLAPDQTYVVEFWATWCPPCRASIPHLTELAHQFTNVVFIGMNVWERGEKTADKVADFVEKMGDQMDYRVAMDTEEGFMAKHWMEAAGRRGIPAAFVVHQGQVVWIGHPMGGLEEILQDITAGGFDLDRARERAATQRREAAESRRIAELYADYLEAVGENGDSEKASALARQIEEANLQSPDLLNTIAWTILTSPGVSRRDLPLATRLAKKALDATREKRADILDTYARALWDSGQRAEAVEYQQKAVAADPKDRGIAVTLERYLDPSRPEGPPLALATERFGAVAAAVDGAIYALGGHSDGGMIGTIERFSPESKTTETLAATIRPRRFFAGAAQDGKIYLIGGDILDDSQTEWIQANVCEEFDPATGTLRKLPDLPVAASRAGAAIVGNRLVVIGGAQEEDGSRTRAVQIFDFETETWSRGADLPVAREGQVFESDGRIYVPGGYDGTSALRDFQVYDPAEDKWSELPKLPVKTSAQHGAVVAGQLYLFGDYEELDRTAVYDLEKKQWALIDIGYKPARHAALAQAGEEVFVIGGNVQPGPPYLNRIQRFSAKQLAEAPRKKWKAAAEKTSEAIRSPSSPSDAESAVRRVRLLSRCGGGTASRAARTPPDPRFFRLKWTQEQEEATARPATAARMDWWIPPRHLVLSSKNKLFIHRASDGGRVRTIPLPAEAQKKEGLMGGGPSFVYLQNGRTGMVIGTQRLYEEGETESGGRSFRSRGTLWLTLSETGEVLDSREEDETSPRVELYVLPAGPDRDLLLKASWNDFQIVDAEGTVLLQQAQSRFNTRWIFRPTPEGGIEAVVIGRDIACYEVTLPTQDEMAAPADDPRLSYAERRRQRVLERAASDPETPQKAETRMRLPSRPAHALEPRSGSKLDFFTDVLERNPDDVGALHWRGFLYALLGNAQASRRDFEKAIRLAPEASNIRWSYGWALLNLGAYDEAAQQWEIMGELDETVPPNGDHHLALAYWAAGQKEHALKIFNATVAREPGFWISREHARRHAAKWTEKEKAILFSLHDAWRRIYTPPADPADYPLPEPDQPASEPE